MSSFFPRKFYIDIVHRLIYTLCIPILDMSIKALSDYTFYSRYARYNKEKQRRETWEEAVDRVFDMHRRRFDGNADILDLLDEVRQAVKDKKILGSQRNLQFAGNPIEKHELKSYNCTTTHIDRARVFAEMMYVLLCGCGAGFSVQKHHIKKLPWVHTKREGKKTHVVEDSIEGWSEAVDELVWSYFRDDEDKMDFAPPSISFDFSEIRPEGSLIAGQFKAPGPNGLKNSLTKIQEVFDERVKSDGFLTDEFKGRLRPIDAYDIIMHISDAVLSGGVRRSATLCMFSHDDKDMINAKIGDWFVNNPQRARSNNSAALLKGSVSKEEFNELIESTKQFGEPGFIWVEDLEIIYNPCCEIAMIPTLDGLSGWQGCNLCEINGKYCDNKEKFFECCRLAAILGTIQAHYTNFKYLDSVSKDIFDREALLGVSITGMMDNPEILFDKKIQKKGAEICKEWNEKASKIIGINQAARITCIKPAGSTSCVLGTASGIHPHHAKRYFRRVQANQAEFHVQKFLEINPDAVDKSVWSSNDTDNVITFLCEVPKGAITKNQISAVDLLKKVKSTQQNWVEYGTRPELGSHPEMRHNTSNTVTVLPEEWDEVRDFIFKNQKHFAGISLLPSSGDKDYAQAPFTTVFTPNEIVRMHGDASVFASGLIVDGLHAFNGNLWAACDCVLGIGEQVSDEFDEPEEPKRPKKNGYTDKQYSRKLATYARLLQEYYDTQEKFDEWWAKKDWVRRVTKFAEKYFDSDIRNATYCLKDVSNWHTWVNLQQNYREIDWSQVVEKKETYQNADEFAAAACAGGKCDII